MNTRILHFAAAMLMTVIGVHADTAMQLTYAGGTAATFVITPGLQVAFDAQSVRVTTASISAADAPTYQIADVKKIDYKEVAGIATVATEPQFAIGANGIDVRNVGPDALCCVCNAAGQVMLSTRVAHAAHIDLTPLAPGVYIVSVGTTAIKVIKGGGL